MWIDALHAAIKAGDACVLVTIAGVQGSAPRHIGARMLVDRKTVTDTIGGGVLEQQAIDHAREMLSDAAYKPLIESKSITLGAELGQCCGGQVTITYEYHPACVFNVVVFGAGHVAQSVATLLTELDCRAQFYDSRDEWLNKLTTNRASVGDVVMHKLGNNPFLAVEHCPDNAFYLVMTHSHQLDFDLVEAILSRGDSVYCGLIASKSKAARFKSRLSRKGFTDSELAKLTAPIGAAMRTGNAPMEVGIAAVAEMLVVRNEFNTRGVKSGVTSPVSS